MKVEKVMVKKIVYITRNTTYKVIYRQRRVLRK